MSALLRFRSELGSRWDKCSTQEAFFFSCRQFIYRSKFKKCPLTGLTGQTGTIRITKISRHVAWKRTKHNMTWTTYTEQWSLTLAWWKVVSFMWIHLPSNNSKSFSEMYFWTCLVYLTLVQVLKLYRKYSSSLRLAENKENIVNVLNDTLWIVVQKYKNVKLMQRPQKLTFKEVYTECKKCYSYNSK